MLQPVRASLPSLALNRHSLSSPSPISVLLGFRAVVHHNKPLLSPCALTFQTSSKQYKLIPSSALSRAVLLCGTSSRNAWLKLTIRSPASATKLGPSYRISGPWARKCFLLLSKMLITRRVRSNANELYTMTPKGKTQSFRRHGMEVVDLWSHVPS